MPSARAARTADLAPIASMLARAFRSDPVAEHLFPSETSRHQSLVRFFELQLLHTYFPRGEVTTYDDHASALLATGPEASPARLVDQFAVLEMVWLLRGRVRTTRRMALQLAATHPVGPHYYVGTIGTEPARQREGLASGLMNQLLARCDLEGLPCCLESSRPSNVTFYEGLGFEVRDTMETPGGGPPVWVMHRSPRPVGTVGGTVEVRG